MEQIQSFDMPPRVANRDREAVAKSREKLAIEDRMSRQAQVRRAQGIVATRAYTEPRWQDKALCSAVNPAIFDSPRTIQEKALAGAFCAACTVTAECGAYGKTVPSSGGLVWGGRHGKTNLIKISEIL